MIRFFKELWDWFTCAEFDDGDRTDEGQDALDVFGFTRR